MLHKTKGIVLNYIKYKETSIIARIYTAEFGLQSYIINGVRSQRSKKGLALLQPLTLLDMVVYHKGNKVDQLQRISEYKSAYTFSSIPFDVKKSSMALFVTELLSKVLKEEDERGVVFEFLCHFVMVLDQKREGFESLHVYLMVHLTHFIGFGIHQKIDLENDNILQRVNTSFDEIYDTLLHLNACDLNDPILLDNRLRKDCLSYMINYYTHHIEGFNELRSLAILGQIFR
ncbi:DNA repair protein RecO [Reichenbachiella agarivorans]|uniref:DNA repair protein RecO n=1 Tax=Reichenbachiella agarivorans TaxID=2979464 RepID=A0ABY6CSU6_9BACT|nr:DNA repair protein RecO [Reichenbachiella agarivorans]UXP33596.1 DNA repair protein RecO [Reichenbachiella agarivorans]